jgi:hypothetical protein
MTAGRYVMVCFVETAGGVPHWELGMLREFTLQAAATATATPTTSAPTAPSTGTGTTGSGAGIPIAAMALALVAGAFGTGGILAVRGVRNR